jgi:hypothetical protein
MNATLFLLRFFLFISLKSQYKPVLLQGANARAFAYFLIYQEMYV